MMLLLMVMMIFPFPYRNSCERGVMKKIAGKTCKVIWLNPFVRFFFAPSLGVFFADLFFCQSAKSTEELL